MTPNYRNSPVMTPNYRNSSVMTANLWNSPVMTANMRNSPVMAANMRISLVMTANMRISPVIKDDQYMSHIGHRKVCILVTIPVGCINLIANLKNINIDYQKVIKFYIDLYKNNRTEFCKYLFLWKDRYFNTKAA